MPDVPQTRFARNGDVHIAYQVFGTGSVDLLVVDTWVHQVEAVWEFPDFARFLRRLGNFARVIHFDRRGTGLSDPVPLDKLPDMETQVDDAVAVLDAAGVNEAGVLGLNDGTLIAMLLAATKPERCSSLVMFATTVKHHQAAGLPMESIEAAIRIMTETQASGESGVEILAPSREHDEAFSRNLARLQRHSVRPGAIGHYFRQSMVADVTDTVTAIRVPTLVVNRADNRIVSADLSREVAELIPGAKLVVLPGTDHLPYSEDLDALVDEIEEFLTGTRTGGDPDRVLATVLFTDIVGSTDMAARVGDRRWRDLLDHHHHVVRGELERFNGTEVATTGDGFLATFDSPGRAVRCALAIVEAVSSLGLAVRAGVHTGEVEVRGNDIGGLAVHIGARVAAKAEPGGVAVSSTVKDLLAGSAIRFEDRGEHELKGIPGTWRLYAATT